MKDAEQKKAAQEFAERWRDRGYEKGESQKYWIDLLGNVLGVEDPINFIEFEDTVHIDKTTGFIDGYIPSTKILIEQKSIDKDLKKAVIQADGSLLKPIQQALKYRANLPYDKQPRWIITCNFKSFLIYDMNNPNGEPEEILLKDLRKDYYRLSFIIDSKSKHIKKEEELSFKAGELVGKLYNAFSKQYVDLNNEQSQKDLNELCVRLVFCLYAEDAGLFERKNVFHDYLNKFEDLNQMRKALIELFKVLDTPINDRDQYLEDDLNQFPYVNGGLFSNENIEIPTFTEEIRSILLAKASDEFDWSEISPTIFGAVFESTLNPETRRAGGMHYTSIENIHKVIDPLFLNDIRAKLDEAESYKAIKTRNEKLLEFQEYISSLTFLDPACGSGNFLTETYLSLRRLENEALEIMEGRQIVLGSAWNPIKVNINQFYGFEINDFAVKVAKTALWIAESQMIKKTEEIVHMNIDFLPLKPYVNIIEGNALQMNWNDFITSNKCSYVMGNPPFVGQQLRTKEQSKDMSDVFNDNNQAGHLDYVACWYKKTCDYIKNTNIKAAFVSTNSICQGEQVPILWKYLYEKYMIKIIFAYRTFHWNSESNDKAAVHCVIVGFSTKYDGKYYIYDNGLKKEVDAINGYLINAPMIFLDARTNNPPSGLPKLIKGSQPTDEGHLLLSKEEYFDFVKKYPALKDIIKPFNGAKEFLNSIDQEKYCFWLKDINPNRYVNNSEIMERLKKVKEFRETSPNEQTREWAKTPYLFTQIRQPNADYIMIPRVSSENRRYIPMAYFSKDIIAGDTTIVLPNANLYLFGILESNVHMSWMRTVCGRLKSDYRYSPAVYNNFPFPNVTEESKKKIEATARQILEARKAHADRTLASLYNELIMPSDLRKAHQENDKAVMEAYGFNWRKMTESDCVAELMKMYEKNNKEK